jgi:competence protein ComEC
MEILCFFAGIAFFYLKNPYPLFFLCSVFLFKPKLSLFFWFIAAIMWSFSHQWLIAERGMPITDLILKANLQGYISSIPNQTPNKTQFQFLAERLDKQPIKTNLLLSCYNHCPEVHAGQHWQLQAKLKKPINLANPGGFDYVGWLSSRHIDWVGNVYPNTFKLIQLKQKHYPLIRLREYLANILAKLVPNEELLGIFEALTLGLTNHIDKTQWDLFRRTGTTHLIDISGEHIALVAGLSYWLFKWVWKHLGNLCLHYPAPKIAGAFAIIISFAYTLIAGFAVPTQRSLITSILMLLRNFSAQRLSVWQSWRYALFAVLLIEPHSVFMLGFYFSFIAVAILILINQRVKAGKIGKILSMQCACLFGLMPLSLYWFSYGSINGLAANLLAIPWVSFLIVPLALIIAFLSPWVVLPGSIALLKWSIICLLAGLRWIDSFEMLNFNFTFIEALSPLSLMASMTVLVFLPVFTVFPAAIILAIASLFPNFEKVPLGEARIDFLDVGQGLAITIRTTNHTLIYDTGMKFYQAGDMGKLTIIPYLNTLGIKKLDKVIISHPDLDHRGGLASLSDKYTIKELIVDDPAFYKQGDSCHHYPSWRWDGVFFKFFPIIEHLPGKNNNSCILQIANSAGKVLLSGDIEKIAEDYLIMTYGNQLASTIMLVPHHGSKTSSSPTYLEQVAPRYAIASYGFDNRYHFPHQQALNAYQRQNVPMYNTKDCGMVRVRLKPNHITSPQCYRSHSSGSR